jgi:hypothetical protein
VYRFGSVLSCANGETRTSDAPKENISWILLATLVSFPQKTTPSIMASLQVRCEASVMYPVLCRICYRNGRHLDFRDHS